MKGKYYTIHLKDWEENIRGWVIDENEDWLLIHSKSNDYVFDGFSFIRKKFIDKAERGEKEQEVELVSELRKESHRLKYKFKFGDIISLIKWIEKKFGMIEFRDEEEDTIFIGTIRKIIRGEILHLNSIDPRGKINKDFGYDFELNKIRVLSFHSNYFNAVKLLWRHRSSGNRISDNAK
jgi:hypothetical protein